jgi:uncharacterized protein YjbJ (UPF0337 family)
MVMNKDTVAGKFDQMKGKVKQSVGEAVGNERLADSGAADQVKGAAKETWGQAKDAAHAVADDANARAQDRQAETGHDVREKITSTAQNVKNAVSAKVDEIKREHKRSA